MTVNTRLQENPVLQRMPKNQQEWVHYQNELAKWVRYIVKLGDGTITTSSGTTISGLNQMPGIVPGITSLNTSSAFNVGSIQTSSPLSAADVGSTTTITIAAHNILYDGVTLAYNSGAIAGLAFNTKFYVYADDATKSGGATSYFSTTTLSTSVASADRYYVGDITTPVDGEGGTTGNPGGGGGGFEP